LLKEQILNVSVIIPAFNEEESIALVLNDIPKSEVSEVVVVNNNSTDATAKIASEHFAVVLFEEQKGYGAACLKGLEYLSKKELNPEVVVFMDADYSDHPEQIIRLLEKIDDGYDMVIGSRSIGRREKGSMLPQQRFGNWLATSLIKWFYKYQYTDLGPFRAITWHALQQINMQDRDFGWTVEMQIKALKEKLRICEVPVDYRTRIGVSKITGTVKGTIMAGYKIIYTIFKYR
jgi:glycosyltransferase involved in cell wall biosynthesis